MKRLGAILGLLAALLPQLAVAQSPVPGAPTSNPLPLQNLPLGQPIQPSDLLYSAQGTSFSPVRVTAAMLKTFIGGGGGGNCSNANSFACLNAANTFSLGPQVVNTNGALWALQSGTLLAAQGPDGVSTSLQVNSFGAPSAINLFAASGTRASPGNSASLANGGLIGRINWLGTNGASTFGPIAAVTAYAEPSALSSSNWNSEVCIGTTPAGQTVLVPKAFCVQPSGGVVVGNAAGGDPGAGAVNAVSYSINGVPLITANIAYLNVPQTFSAAQTFAAISGYTGNVRTQASTACTFNTNASGCSGAVGGDCGTFIQFTNAADITVTIPASLPLSCEIAMEQASTGRVIPVAGAGATFHWAHGFTASSGLYSVIGLTVVSNPGGVAATAIGNGDGA